MIEDHKNPITMKVTAICVLMFFGYWNRTPCNPFLSGKPGRMGFITIRRIFVDFGGDENCLGVVCVQLF
jgi:hypothetical protein